MLVAGYGATVGTADVATSNATTYPRVVGRIDASGTIDTSTTLGAEFSSKSVRGATSTDGVSIWVSGNGNSLTGGVLLTTFGSTAASQVLLTPSNVRFVHIFDNQLYGTSGSAMFTNVFAIGTGVPTTPGQTGTTLAGMSTATGPSPYSFALVDRSPAISGLDTLYVADDEPASAGGGVQRWVYNGTSWKKDATFKNGTVGVRGLAAAIEGNGVRILATTAENIAPNRILSIFDEPGSSPTIVAIATSPANTFYRGVALAPK